MLKLKYSIITCALIYAYVWNYIALYLDTFLGALTPVNKWSRSGSPSPTRSGVRPEFSRPSWITRIGRGLPGSSLLGRKNHLWDRFRVRRLTRANNPSLIRQASQSTGRLQPGIQAEWTTSWRAKISFGCNHNIVSDFYLTGSTPIQWYFCLLQHPYDFEGNGASISHQIVWISQPACISRQGRTGSSLKTVLV